mmetsp:Transcript_18943/g.72309  ORF Transcript_18943/g.72309 Transcript_18943/m.72309 type:complete len:209 (-) Transcript_18943:641-1267(-)
MQAAVTQCSNLSAWRSTAPSGGRRGEKGWGGRTVRSVLYSAQAAESGEVPSQAASAQEPGGRDVHQPANLAVIHAGRSLAVQQRRVAGPDLCPDVGSGFAAGAHAEQDAKQVQQAQARTLPHDSTAPDLAFVAAGRVVEGVFGGRCRPGRTCFCRGQRRALGRNHTARLQRLQAAHGVPQVAHGQHLQAGAHEQQPPLGRLAGRAPGH